MTWIRLSIKAQVWDTSARACQKLSSLSNLDQVDIYNSLCSASLCWQTQPVTCRWPAEIKWRGPGEKKPTTISSYYIIMMRKKPLRDSIKYWHWTKLPNERITKFSTLSHHYLAAYLLPPGKHISEEEFWAFWQIGCWTHQWENDSNVNWYQHKFVPPIFQ